MLEVDLYCKLDLTRAINCVWNVAKRSVTEALVWLIKLSCVEDIEHLSSELQIACLTKTTQGENSLNREIRIRLTGTSER